LQLTLKDKEEISRKLFDEAQAKQKEDGYIKLKKVREKLPIFATREKFLDTLAKNQVVVLTGETGSGKTTQVSLSFKF
jgi:HrpA-like RNA helicase